jgi:hypothetical protein
MLEVMRNSLETARREAEAEGQESKEAMLPIERLRDAYSRFTPSEQVLGEQVLAEWLDSDDENRRFDALALIDEFRVVAMAPALGRLADRLRESRAPGASFEREKIGRIMDRLEGLETRGIPRLSIADLKRRIMISSPADLSAILAMIRASVSGGHLTEAHRQGCAVTRSDVADLPAGGPWPDVVDAVFRDRAGRRYRLLVETYHGAGGSWTPLDSDD